MDIKEQYPEYNGVWGNRSTREEGNRYGKLVVLYRYYKNNNDNKIQWVCQCDCGNIKVVAGKELRQGKIISCGCAKTERIKQLNYNDLTNKKFGMLTALYDTGRRDNGHSVWHCRCDCGNEVDIVGIRLSNGSTKSCGCATNILIAQSKLKGIPIGTKFGNLTVISEPKIRNGTLGFYNCKCDCGNIVTIQGADLRSGNTSSCGCIKSKGELFVGQTLLKLGLTFEKEYKFQDLLSQRGNSLKFDFAVIDNNNILFLIEYDGIQHFTTQGWNDEEHLKQNQYNDELKNQYCKNNDIKLLRIKYTNNTYEKVYNQIIIFIKENFDGLITGN